MVDQKRTLTASPFESAPSLEVVHRSDEAVWVWLVGNKNSRRVEIRYKPRDSDPVKHPTVVLKARNRYMTVATIGGLDSDTTYDLEARFPRRMTPWRWLREFLFGRSRPVELHTRLAAAGEQGRCKPAVFVMPTAHDCATLWALGVDRDSSLAKIDIRPSDDRAGSDQSIELRPVAEDKSDIVGTAIGKFTPATSPWDPLDLTAENQYIARATISKLERETEYHLDGVFVQVGQTAAESGEPTELARFKTPINPDAPRLILIIGHTKHDSAVIWVRGDKHHTKARIVVNRRKEEVPEGSDRQEIESDLDKSTHFTAARTFTDLEAGGRYEVEVHFGKGKTTETLHGEFRTFPDPHDEDASRKPFSFLHGSCNLSTVGITNMGGLAMGGLGWISTKEALRRPIHTWDFGRLSWLPHLFRRLVRKGIPTLSGYLVGSVAKLTGFEQPEQLFPSPFENLHKLVQEGGSSDGNGAKPDKPAFMIHAGDQIYFDIPRPRRAPEVDKYRREYVNNWAEDLTLRGLLAHCPHYMILDDHEIVDGFAEDHVPEPPPKDEKGNEYTAVDYLKEATQAYREFVHSRQPGGESSPEEGPFHYEFSYGTTHFFALDTRTERSLSKGRMIGDNQLEELETWLKRHKADLKFVISSVPFLAELEDSRHTESAFDDPVEGSSPDDKWCGGAFRGQRDRLLEFLHEEGIGRLVFLVGDMHCGYHCTTRVGSPKDRITLHEIAGGPFHQLLFTSRKRFQDHHRSFTTGDKRRPLTTWMRGFNASAIGAMLISVHGEESPEVDWKVVPMHRQFSDPDRPGLRTPLAGRISF